MNKAEQVQRLRRALKCLAKKRACSLSAAQRATPSVEEQDIADVVTAIEAEEDDG